MQLNRRYITGLQFALAYTLAKGYDTRVTSPYIAADQDWFWRAPTGGTQLHNLSISYTWDVPDGSSLWDNALDAARSTAGSSRATRRSSRATGWA